MHGEEVHADQNPTPRFPEVPSLEEVRADHEGDGEQVEQIRQGQVDDVNVHGGGGLHGVAHDDQRVDVPRDSNEAHDGEDGADGEGGGRVLEHGHGGICAVGAPVHEHFCRLHGCRGHIWRWLGGHKQWVELSERNKVTDSKHLGPWKSGGSYIKWKRSGSESILA